MYFHMDIQNEINLVTGNEKISSSIQVVKKLRYVQPNYPASDLHKLHELFKCHRDNFLSSK